MKPFSELVLKVFSAYLMFSSLSNVIPLFFNRFIFNDGIFSDEVLSFLIGWAVIPTAVGLCLWVFSSHIAQKFSGDPQSEVSITEQGLISAGTFLIGLYWAIKSVGMVIVEYSTSSNFNYGWLLVLFLSVGLMGSLKYSFYIYRKLRYLDSNQ